MCDNQMSDTGRRRSPLMNEQRSKRRPCFQELQEREKTISNFLCYKVKVCQVDPSSATWRRKARQGPCWAVGGELSTVCKFGRPGCSMPAARQDETALQNPRRCFVTFHLLHQHQRSIVSVSLTGHVCSSGLCGEAACCAVPTHGVATGHTPT